MTAEPTEAQEHGPRAHGLLRLVPALLAMTVVSGIIDAVSYLGLGHVFTANMTGNVVVLGFAAAGAPGFSTAHALVSLGSFLVGAVAGGRLARRYGGGSRRARARLALAIEAVLLGTSSAVAFATPGATGTVYTLIAVTAFAMGLRNATVRKLAVAELTTTTVLTTTLTGLASDSRIGGGPRGWSPRRTSSVLALLAGALLGGWLVLHHGLGVPLLVAALAAGVLAMTTSGRE
ncbi:YoaK family protein [Streptomyces yaanensis]|uniref:YoaK family protein n=1 Tax=Streptomyces yaanensis TaxID=1142239 RepID=A0ABV7SMY2_9ACTN|nr:YoaK family protein [Streptomyces sp. CGMCC 4.7035]WNC01575.1 YoaK family protein [Streptomyces sp. CGMCC 4.7035]